MKPFNIDEHSDEILQLTDELRELIEYDYWSAMEYGNTSVDLYETAVNLIKAGYRKVG